MSAPPANTVVWDTSVMKLNVQEDVILNNIKTNMKHQLPQLVHHQEQATPICIVGGGWSLNETIEELRELYFEGAKIVALNNAISWLVEHNFKPSMQLVMDARPNSLNFISENVPGCKYLLASQCDPSLFEKCIAEERDTTIFHVVSTEIEDESGILDDYYMKRWVRVPGAGTIGIVSLMLLRILGFKYLHLFGIDSCYPPDGGYHHAYPQAVNDKEGTGTFWCAGEKWKCAAWQASQATNFVNVIKAHGELMKIAVHGNGLLAHMVKTGGSLTEEK